MNDLNDHIQGLKEGSDESFLFIFNYFESSLLNHIFKMVGNLHLAEEILQEVMISLISKIDQYEHKSDLKNSFKAWVFRIATNRAIDEIRKTKSQVSFDSIKFDMSLDDSSVEINDTGMRIGTLINQLPILQRTILNLKVNEQMSLKEISLVCQCEINAVKQTLFRGRRTLKDLMIGEGII